MHTTRTLNRARHRLQQADKAATTARTALLSGDIDKAIRSRNLASRLTGTAKRLLRAEAKQAEADILIRQSYEAESMTV